ncbi:hypothetical protein NCS52_01024000 [Fusarium sp. LHS14.1]|nr:hypothetical protein NCS52_01024000 [Fusarium sp. LHS14.1]
MSRQPTALDTSTESPTCPTQSETNHHLHSSIIMANLSFTIEAPVSPSAQAGADRCMRHTQSWTPDFGPLQRRQSWSAEDKKHQMHMAKIDHVATGPGFSEGQGA